MKLTNRDLKHLAYQRKQPVYVPWAFFACVFGLVAILTIAVAMLFASEDTEAGIEVGRSLMSFLAMPAAALSGLCITIASAKGK